MAAFVVESWDIRSATAWPLLSARVCASLVELDIWDAAGFRGLFDGTPDTALPLAEELGGSGTDVLYLCDVWQKADLHASRLIRASAALSTPMLSAASACLESEDRNKRQRIFMQTAQRSIAAPQVALATKWPTKLRRSLALAGDKNAK